MSPDELSDRLGFDVSRETFDRLGQYHDLLLSWSKTHNLIGPKEHAFLWDRHIIDSLQIWPLISGAGDVVDIGSGAGLPGLVLACAAVERDDTHLVLVESNSKRCAFLRHVSHSLDLPVTVLNSRIENVSRETPGAITARAVTDLTSLMSYSEKWLLKGTKGVFLKGRTWKDELTEARRYWTFNVDVTPSRSDSQGAVLTLSEVRTNG